MFKPIPGNDSYLISLKREIRRVDGTPVKLPLHEGKVEITLHNKKQWVCVEWLSLIAHFEVNLKGRHREVFHRIRFTDMAKFPSHPVSGKWMVLPKPLYYKENYRLIPGYLRYAVSKTGKVIDTYSGDVLDIVRGSGYVYVNLYDSDKSKKRSVYLHRLVALAWVKCPCFLTLPYVNHKYGDKNNPYYTNLEWCSAADNIIHAYKEGLRTDNLACKTLDHHTGEMAHYFSLSEVEDALSLTKNTLRVNCVYLTTAKRIADRYELCLEQEEFGTIKHFKNNNYLLEVSVDDKVYVVEGVEKLKQLVRQLGPLRGQDKAVAKGYSASSLEGVIYQCALSYGQRVKIKILKDKQLLTEPYQALHLPTMQTYTDTSIKGLAARCNVDWSTIRSILLKQENVLHKDYLFRLYSDTKWDMDYSVPKTRSKGIRATHLEKGTIKEFNSLREASSHFKRDRSLIKQRLLTGKPYEGWALSEI